MVKNEVFYVFFAYANVSDCLTFVPFCLSLVYLAIRWFKKHSNAWYYNKRHIITEVSVFDSSWIISISRKGSLRSVK